MSYLPRFLTYQLTAKSNLFLIKQVSKMRKTKSLILALLFFVSCFCQNKSTEEKVPFLIGGTSQNTLIKIFDNYLSDSLKVVFQVVVNLEHPLRDTTEHIKVKDVEILRMLAISLSTNEKVIDYSYINSKGSKYQKYIWDLCLKKFSYWYNYQPYDRMIDRNQWGDRIVLGGTVYIIPNK
jgi:hypothetical protein